MAENLDRPEENERISHHHPHPLTLTLIKPSEDGEIWCDGCLTPIAGSGFSCQSCSFFLHENCTKLPLELPEHPLHPNGPLKLHLIDLEFAGEIKSSWCKLCNRYIIEGFNYKCDEKCRNGCDRVGDFMMHSNCALMEPSIIYPNHKHPLFSIKEFYCRAKCVLCGLEFEHRKGGSNLYRCLECDIRVHRSCLFRFPSEIGPCGGHLHTSKLYLDPLSEDFEDYGTSCSLCKQERNISEGFYACKECYFVCHVQCTNSGSLLAQVEESYEDLGHGRLNHCFHFCDLDSYDSRVNKGEKCAGCQSLIIDEDQAYGCDQCGFFLHEQCAKSPKKLRHRLHSKGPLTLVRIGDLYSPPCSDDYLCKLCYLPIDKRFFYECKENCELCSRNGRVRIHMDCAALEPTRKHPGHKHRLVYVKAGICYEMCVGCGARIMSGLDATHFYRCLECSFRLHKECFNFPHKDERTDCRGHPLTIYYDPLPKDYDEDDYFCDWCNERRDVHTFSYVCQECDYVCHTRCDAFSKTSPQRFETSKDNSTLRGESLQLESPNKMELSIVPETSIDDGLLSIKPSSLKFLFELNKQTSCFLLLENKSSDHIAFKVKTTNVKKYIVKPKFQGFLSPGQKHKLTVTMAKQKTEPPSMQCKDKFKILSVVVSEGMSMEEQITEEMFNKEAGHFVEETILRVIYVSPHQWPSSAGSVSSRDIEDGEENKDQKKIEEEKQPEQEYEDEEKLEDEKEEEPEDEKEEQEIEDKDE